MYIYETPQTIILNLFTKEDQSNVPTLDADDSFPNLPDITFSVESI